MRSVAANYPQFEGTLAVLRLGPLEDDPLAIRRDAEVVREAVAQ